MSNPVAAHTFDFVRVYLSTRTGGVPGSGTWSVATIIFDGTQQLSTIPECRSFSAGGLQAPDPYGIVGDSGNANHDLAFLASGLPTAPAIISYPGQVGHIVRSDYWDTSQGAFYYDGSSGGSAGYFLPHYCNGENVLRIAYSATGVSWAQSDPTNAPVSSDGTTIALQRVDEMLYFFVSLDGSDTNWSILPFDMSTGLYGTAFAAITIANLGFFAKANSDTWSNGLFKLPNGDFAVIYQEDTGANNVVYRLWTAAGPSWGSTITLPSGATGYGNSVMDPALDSIHVLTYGDSVLDPVNYHNITHPGNVLTTILAAIPAPVSFDTDGIGHSSIQNGMIFVPRDDSIDFDNSIWVATLPVVTFFKELLPIPPGETNAVQMVSAGAPGSGYANGNILTLAGGEAGYPATVIVTSVDGGGGVLTVGNASAGGGYSIAAGVATTGGAGTGATANIDAVTGKTPSCSYMMFPNGYSLTITPLSLACPVGGGTATVGVPYSKFLVRTGGVAPFTFAFISGQASWMTLDTATGEITGTPDVAGTVNYSAMVTDADGNTDTT